MLNQVNKVVLYGQFSRSYEYDRTVNGQDLYITEFESDQSNKRYGFKVRVLLTLDDAEKIVSNEDYRITGTLEVSTKFSNFIVLPTEVIKVSDLDEVGRYLSSIDLSINLVKTIDSYKSRNLMICLGRFDSKIAKSQHVRMLCYARTGAFVNSVLIPGYSYQMNVSGYLNSYINDDQASTSIVVTKFTLDPEDDTRTHKNKPANDTQESMSSEN